MTAANRRWALVAGLWLILQPIFAAPVLGQDVTSFLIGHWRLAETSGTTAVDLAPTPHNGTFMGGVALAGSTPLPYSGVLAARFDGVDDSVAIGSESTFDFTDYLSVAVWVKVNAFDVADQDIVTKGNGAWRLHRNGATNGVSFTCTGLGNPTAASSTNINDGKWHHIVGQRLNNQLRIYIDGVLNTTRTGASGTIATNNFDVEIGSNSETNGGEFDGSIYDVRIYHRTLDALAVSYLYLQGGPVGHWKLNDGTGVTVADSSIYALSGAVTGGATWTSRCDGVGALDFNGSGNYVTVANASQLQIISAVSMAAWVHGDAWGTGTDVDTILRKGNGSPLYRIAIADGRLQARYQSGGASAAYLGNTVLDTNRWRHVAATWDGNFVKLYVDGKPDNTPAAHTALASNAQALYLGGYPGGSLFDGKLMDLRLYNRELLPFEIANIYGLIGHWQFNEGTGTTAADTSGIGNNAALSGGASWTTDCAGNKALLTNGTGGIAATAAAFDPPREGTVAFWMRGSGPLTSTGRLCGVNGDWEIRQGTNGVLSFDLGGSPYVGNEPFSTLDPVHTDGRWRHIAAVFSDVDNSFSVYVDGALRTSGISPVDLVPQLAGTLSFGTRTGSTEYWKGTLRDFRIYNRRLCATDIADLAGLAAYWKLDESSGTVAVDASPFGRNGTIIGTPAWTAGKLNNGLQLDGSTYVSAAGLMGSPRNVTLAAWANLTTADTSGAEVISLGNCLAIRLNEGGQSRALFYDGTTWLSAGITQTFGAGWRHFAAVFDDDNNVLRFYVNGSQAASLSTTASITYAGMGANTTLGRHGNGSGSYDFTGKIDDVRVYSRALCPEQIQEIVNDGGGTSQGVKTLQWVESR